MRNAQNWGIREGRFSASNQLLRQILRENREEVPGSQDAVDPKLDEGERKLEALKTTASLATINPERRYISLVGFDMVFIGFALQGVGAIASLIDILWTQCGKIAELPR